MRICSASIIPVVALSHFTNTISHVCTCASISGLWSIWVLGVIWKTLLCCFLSMIVIWVSDIAVTSPKSLSFPHQRNVYIENHIKTIANSINRNIFFRWNDFFIMFARVNYIWNLIDWICWGVYRIYSFLYLLWFVILDLINAHFKEFIFYINHLLSYWILHCFQTV